MQNILDNFAKSVDKRTSLFDVKIDSESNGTLTLSGRVLDKSQLDNLPRLFPDRKLDTASIRILYVVVTRLVGGTVVGVEEKRGEWSLVNANKTGWLPSSALRALIDTPVNVDEKRSMMIEDATRMIGVPYLWGGISGNGIDCSGFIRLLHRWVGIQIPRDADMQSNAAFLVEPPYQVGDLFFFAEGDSKRGITHVGMSLGGWNMIHSSRMHNGVDVDNVQEVKYFKDKFINAGSFLRRI